MNAYFGAMAHVTQTCSLSPPDPRAAQLRCDAVQAEFRREQPQSSTPRREPPPPAKPLVTDEQLKLRLAEEIDYARRVLDHLADELSADIHVVMRHSVGLQAFDIVGQALGHVANVIRSSEPGEAVQQIGMCELKARLLRRSVL